jgi:hypothetical protein
MRVVIQCAGSKRPEAGTFRTADSRRVAFVADPALGPCTPDVLYAHPDEPSDQPGQTWRDRVVEANRTRTNPCGLLPAGRLYAPEAYALLERFVGPERLFILSAGWGLVRSDFLLPRYDITFSGSAARHKRRRPAHDFADFNALDGLPADDTAFLGGKDYLPLFLRLSAACRGRRLVLHNSTVPPAAPGCGLQAFRTSCRTNWHYQCARALASGSLELSTAGT